MNLTIPSRADEFATVSIFTKKAPVHFIFARYDLTREDFKIMSILVKALEK